MSATRREFLSSSAIAVGYFVLPTVRTMANDSKSPNARPRVGCIGVGGQGSNIGRATRKFGDIVAVCDVDHNHAEKFNQSACQGKAAVSQDHRRLLDRNDVDVVTIGTPDHWHTKICLDALRAGKDIYCEKPLTLTIDEGKQLCRTVSESKRVLQVGTQQRSEHANRFLKAVALVYDGRIGKVKRVVCGIDSAPSGGPFQLGKPVPAGLDWDRWLGQTPAVEYLPERCHGTFRWWYEYSGGKITDWGAHHVDIGQWAISMDATGPTTIEPVAFELKNSNGHGKPARADSYNTPTTFDVRCQFPNGVELVITSAGENGITFEGETGKFFVNRDKLTGGPVDDLRDRPLPADALTKLRKGKRLDGHMANFFECCRDRSLPVSDVYSHHRALTTCHLANIAIRLGRKLTWDPTKEQIVGDAEANSFLSREQRKGYETNA